MRILLAIALLAGCGTPDPSWQQAVADWQWPAPLPDVPLVDQDGEAFRLARHREDWVLLGFVFTRCGIAEACPLTMTRMRAIQERWHEAEADAGGADLHLLALTLDPAWDTPARLRAWGTAHGVDFADFTLATGPEPLLADALPSMLSILALPDAEQTVRHSVKLVLLRPGLTIEAEWPEAEVEAGAVVARILSEHGRHPR